MRASTVTLGLGVLALVAVLFLCSTVHGTPAAKQAKARHHFDDLDTKERRHFDDLDAKDRSHFVDVYAKGSRHFDDIFTKGGPDVDAIHARGLAATARNLAKRQLMRNEEMEAKKMEEKKARTQHEKKSMAKIAEKWRKRSGDDEAFDDIIG